MKICKIQQPPIFTQKLQISIKSDFPNQFFKLLKEFVQEGEYFGAYMVLIHAHFLQDLCLQIALIAWNTENSIKPSLLQAKSTVFGI